MKTIFIPILQGVEAKNILRTDIFKYLSKEKGVRIILLVSNENKKKYFEKEFYGPNIVYEVIDEYSGNRFDRLFSFLKMILSQSMTMQVKRKRDLRMHRNYLKYILESLLSKVLAKRIIRNLVRWFNFIFIKDNNFNVIFNKYEPSLVFSAHIFGDIEASILKQAKKRGIKTIGLINSWDKITSRGMVRLLPDKLIVHNNIIKREAIEYVDMKEKDIIVVGIPQNDIFFNSKPISRREFSDKLKLGISKKIILFCPMGKTFSDFDTFFINLISDFYLNKQINCDVKILVRFPPNDNVDLSGIKNKDILLFEHPGKRFSAERGLDWDMDNEDIEHLFNTLYHSSLVISPPSSICIDAAILDRPIINLKFDLHQNDKKGVNSYYDMEHYLNIIKTKGVKLVKNEEELIFWINKYLQNPKIDSENRQKLVKEQCLFLDGKSGKRIADYIIKFLK